MYSFVISTVHQRQRRLAFRFHVYGRRRILWYQSNFGYYLYYTKGVMLNMQAHVLPPVLAREIFYRREQDAKSKKSSSSIHKCVDYLNYPFYCLVSTVFVFYSACLNRRMLVSPKKMPKFSEQIKVIELQKFSSIIASTPQICVISQNHLIFYWFRRMWIGLRFWMCIPSLLPPIS